jgi:hypothetical protein
VGARQNNAEGKQREGGGGGRTRSWCGGGGGRRVRGWVALFRGRARRVAACRHAPVAQGHRFKYQEITF